MTTIEKYEIEIQTLIVASGLICPYCFRGVPFTNEYELVHKEEDSNIYTLYCRAEAIREMIQKLRMEIQKERKNEELLKS